jgi:hypothetical protein
MAQLVADSSAYNPIFNINFTNSIIFVISEVQQLLRLVKGDCGAGYEGGSTFTSVGRVPAARICVDGSRSEQRQQR